MAWWTIPVLDRRSGDISRQDGWHMVWVNGVGVLGIDATRTSPQNGRPHQSLIELVAPDSAVHSTYPATFECMS